MVAGRPSPGDGLRTGLWPQEPIRVSQIEWTGDGGGLPREWVLVALVALYGEESDYLVGVEEALREEMEEAAYLVPGEVTAATVSDVVSSKADAVKGGLEDTLEAMFELLLAELTVICSHERGLHAVEPGGDALGFAVMVIECILVAISGKGATQGCSKAV